MFQAAHYIGEMCRYVLATPPSPTDKQHKVRVVYGNGMRPTVRHTYHINYIIIHVNLLLDLFISGRPYRGRSQKEISSKKFEAGRLEKYHNLTENRIYNI